MASRRTVTRVTVLGLLLCAGLFDAQAWGASRDDRVNFPERFGCNGIDDTPCWQRAVEAGRPAGDPRYFAGLRASAGVTYVLRDTITIDSVYGGVIDGNGALIQWQGPPDRPLFLLRNTQQLRFTNLRIFVVKPLQAAFEFAKAPYGKDPEGNVAPSGNVLDHVRVEGVRLGNLQYGVRFSRRYGIDEDNDQSTIIDSAFLNVTEAAISIEHSQSQGHHFIAVKASGAEGNQNAAFVRATGGSFSSIGGFHGRFRGAVYDIAAVFGNDMIIGENSEASAHFIRTPRGVASFPMPVQVVGGRFAVDAIAADGLVIDFNRMGPLNISGLSIDGVVPAGVARPTLSFRPEPVGGRGEGRLNISGLSFLMPGSSEWEPIAVGPNARVNASGNVCAEASGSVTRCRGLAQGVTAPGEADFADLRDEAFRGLAPGHQVYCADCGKDEGSGACRGGGLGHVATRARDGWRCD